MGREACCRHDMAYPVSWRRVTHLQRSWRWGNASRFESSRAAILNDKSLRNRVYVRFRRLFCFSHRTCDPSSKWAVRGTAKLRQTAGKPGHAHARRVARSAEHLGGRRRSAVGGRPPFCSCPLFSFRPFSVSVCGTLTKIAPPLEIRGYKLKGLLKYFSQNKILERTKAYTGMYRL